MLDTDMADASASLPLFRSKKRKLYRQRVTSPDSHGSGTPILEAPLSPTSLRSMTLSPGLGDGDNIEEEGTPNVAEILRMRKLRKHRVGGVEFRVASPATSTTSQELVPANAKPKDTEEQGGLNVGKRFVGQTGTLTEGVDKHMMEYIDAGLAQRHNHTVTNGTDIRTNNIFNTPRSDEIANPIAAAAHREPVSLGKIQEVDLVQDPTERARNRIINKTPLNALQQPKPRIGRNGKPYIPKNRNRRNSDDIRRDALVEAVLTENTLGYYEQSKPSMRVSVTEAGHDEDADEALMEKFTKDFMDAASERQRKRPAAPPPMKTSYGPKEDEPLKGPKLGGSRTQRAAMREMLLKAEKGKK